MQKRAESGAMAARALLADVHLALGEVALESETYDKAVVDMGIIYIFSLHAVSCI